MKEDGTKAHRDFLAGLFQTTRKPDQKRLNKNLDEAWIAIFKADILLKRMMKHSDQQRPSYLDITIIPKK